jgi:hypothetical protein
MPGLINDLKKSVGEYKSELLSLKSKTLNVNRSVCNLDDVVSSIQTSTQTQENKIAALESFNNKLETFISDVVRIDGNVADLINKNKDDFYNEYPYLKPDIEKDWREKLGDKFKSFGEWCKEHWQEIVITIVIVVGAVLAIAAVIATGGLALVPLLTAGLTALGVSAGTALSIATVASITVAVVAVTSTLASSTLNIIDTWCDMSGNSTFKSWQTAMNWTAAISNGLYSVGSIYNSVKGVSGKEFIARDRAIANGRRGYGDLDSAHPRMQHKPGGDFDGRKDPILQENMRRNGGVLRSDQTGKVLEWPKQGTTGRTPPPNEANIDHIFPRALGGDNSFKNAQVIERQANGAKSTNQNFTPKDFMNNSVPDTASWSNAFKSAFAGNFSSGVNLGIKGD